MRAPEILKVILVAHVWVENERGEDTMRVVTGFCTGLVPTFIVK